MPGPYQRLLGRILREFGVAQDEASDPVQPIDGAGRQDAEGLTVSASRPVDEFRPHASLLPGTTVLVAYTLRRRTSGHGSKSARASGDGARVAAIIREVAPSAAPEHDVFRLASERSRTGTSAARWNK